MKIPESLSSSVERGYFDRAWVDALPARVEDACARWRLEVGEPYDPGGNCSWVAPVVRDGEKLVLKVGLRHPEAEDEAAGLRAWGGQGAVRLHESHTTETTVDLVLERCEPGMVLRSLDEYAQDEVIADRLLRLWSADPDGHPFRPLSQMTQMWIETLERDLAARHCDVDTTLVDEARRIYREEANNCKDQRLLCTDLHAGNVLAAEREPWLVIDPKPFVGDPAYDTVQHMLNCVDRLDEDPFEFAERMATLTGTDPGRVTMWLFARVLQESLGDEPHQERLRPVAERLACL